MGNQQSTSSHTFDKQPKGYLDGWQSIDHLAQFDVVRNNKSGQLGQAKKFKLDPMYDPQKQIQIYDRRKHTNFPIVKAYSAELLEKVSKKMAREDNPGLCASANYLGVITERIPYLLGDLPDLEFPQSLYILKSALQGYSYLFPRMGPAHITQNMIGLNTEGQVKVWINDNFAYNWASHEIHSLQSTRNHRLDRQYNLISPQFRDEKEMVENIADVVQETCHQANYPLQFSLLLKENCESFQQAQQFLNNYLFKQQINLPKRIQIQQLDIQEKFYSVEQTKSHQISQHISTKNQTNFTHQNNQKLIPNTTPTHQYSWQTPKTFNLYSQPQSLPQHQIKLQPRMNPQHQLQTTQHVHNQYEYKPQHQPQPQYQIQNNIKNQIHPVFQPSTQINSLQRPQQTRGPFLSQISSNNQKPKINFTHR